MINNDNNVNFLNYNGIVTLKLINQRNKRIKSVKTIHNNGTKNLFNYLCNALKGTILSNGAPKAIDACKYTFEDSNLAAIKTSLAYRVLISGKSIINDFKDDKNENYDYITRFSAIIPYSAILSDAIEGNKSTIKNLQLHSHLSQKDNEESLLAYINLGDDSIEISEGEALLVEWNIGFKNPTITQ